MSSQFSRWLALVGGLALPVLETMRRWQQLGDWRALPAWLDDWVIGAMLLLGFWQTRNGMAHGRHYLAVRLGLCLRIGVWQFFVPTDGCNPA